MALEYAYICIISLYWIFSLSIRSFISFAYFSNILRLGTVSVFVKTTKKASTFTRNNSKEMTKILRYMIHPVKFRVKMQVIVE